ncbi:MAG: hypothetical protein BGO98_10275 [Myxococcales bacterium 68-20]|nr:MAG: hypothetical protein BGO98_10275 [Myxococcales bacterium 68-20]
MKHAASLPSWFVRVRARRTTVAGPRARSRDRRSRDSTDALPSAGAQQATITRLRDHAATSSHA